MKTKVIILVVVAVITLSFNVVKSPKSQKTYNPELERSYKSLSSTDRYQFN